MNVGPILLVDVCENSCITVKVEKAKLTSVKIYCTVVLPCVSEC